MGTETQEVGEEGDYLTLHCHHQYGTCITMGSDESRFNVLLTVRDNVTRQCPQAHNYGTDRRAEAESNLSPSAYQPDAEIRQFCNQVS